MRCQFTCPCGGAGTDVERITQGLRVFHEAWANLAEVSLAVWLWNENCMLPPSHPWWPPLSRWMEALETRINTTISLLSSMKGVRMTGMTEKSYKLVHALRPAELKHANGFRMIQVFSFCIAFTPIFITPVACFAIYMAMSRTSSDDQPLDVATVFTSLSLVVILTQPLSSLFQYIPMFLGAANCLKRVQDFLQSTSHKDPRDLISFSSEAMASIIGFSPVDEAWYGTVIHASDLETDLKGLEKGDQTMVGSNGDALSTGQRQRVAIARAVYSRKPVIILDDVFSGMDNITRNRIFSRLLGPHGVLRMRNTTVILACHDQQPLLSPGHVITLRSNHPPAEGIPKPSPRADTLESTVQSSSASRTISGREGSKTTEKQKERSKAAENKKARPRPSDWNTYKYFSSAVGLPNAFVLLALGAAFGVLYTFPSVWVNWWTADAGKDDFYLGIYALLQTAALACWFLFTRHSLTTVVSKSGSRLHDRLLSTVTSATMPYLSSADAGSIINRFSQDLQMVDGELPAAMLNTIATAFIALAQVVLVATASPWLAVSYPFLLLVFFGVQKFYPRTSQQLRPLDLELKSPLYSHFIDTLRGISTIRAFGWRQKHVERNYQLLDASQRPYYQLPMIQQRLSLVLKLVVLVISALLASLTVKLRSGLGFTGVALVNFMSLSQMLRSVIVGWTLMETSITAVTRIKNFEEDTPKEEDVPAGGAPEGWPLSGRVEVQNLTVSYGLGSEKPALRDVSLAIKAGKKLGICGRSGRSDHHPKIHAPTHFGSIKLTSDSGKSSFVASLFRMTDIRQGRVLIDGTDITECPLSSLRSSINAFPQDPFFTEGTFHSNVGPYETSSDSEIQHALRKVCMWDEVQNNDGLGSAMKPESFGQGQKQLFSLARALLRRCRIVVLDEVTSSLDSEPENLVWAVLQDAFEGCTIIAVAHRLETIQAFDCVAVLDDGQVVECGDPASLLKRQDSAFSQLLAASEKSS
ncbi:ABC multidrug transporter [Colletotrichum musicola]|uniref:ABC multidrug transporter n=1 Tax=Colletotrichum musicola TaxID=2175873 RepID=A0A8H6J6J1_9PEZI|nr:ABC multidrug transporter [Colletotrichum musicola]